MLGTPGAADSRALETGSNETGDRNLAHLNFPRELVLSPEEQIRGELTAIELGVGEVLTRILRCGNLFRAQRDRLQHGEFGPWLEREFPHLQRRTISRWMRAADTYNEQRKTGHAVSTSLSLRRLLGMDESRPKRDAGGKKPMVVEVLPPQTPEAMETERAIEILTRQPHYGRRYGRMVKELRDAEIALRNASARVVAAARKVQE